MSLEAKIAELAVAAGDTIKRVTSRLRAVEAPVIYSSGLYLNGAGQTGDNTNWPGLARRTDTFPFGAKAAYAAADGYVFFSAPDLIPVTSAQMYQLQFSHRYISKVTPGCALFVGMEEFDVDGNTISAQECMRFPESDTTLAADLKPGDTVIRLTSAAGWNNAGETYERVIGFYTYRDSTGYLYRRDIMPYTRYRTVATRGDTLGTWNAGGVNTSNNTITLAEPWTYRNPNDPEGIWRAGTDVSNTTSGGTFRYLLSMWRHGQTGATEWQTTRASFGGGVDMTGGGGGNGLFRPGTARVRLIALMNLPTGGQPTTGDVCAIGGVFFDRLPTGVDLTSVTTRVTALEARPAATQGPAGPKGDKGDKGDKGATGPGVPAGGTAGQVLSKTDSADYSTQWSTLRVTSDGYGTVLSTGFGFRGTGSSYNISIGTSYDQIYGTAWVARASTAFDSLVCMPRGSAISVNASYPIYGYAARIDPSTKAILSEAWSTNALTASSQVVGETTLAFTWNTPIAVSAGETWYIGLGYKAPSTGTTVSYATYSGYGTGWTPNTNNGALTLSSLGSYGYKGGSATNPRPGSVMSMLIAHRGYSGSRNVSGGINAVDLVRALAPGSGSVSGILAIAANGTAAIASPTFLPSSPSNPSYLRDIGNGPSWATINPWSPTVRPMSLTAMGGAATALASVEAGIVEKGYLIKGLVINPSGSDMGRLVLRFWRSVYVANLAGSTAAPGSISPAADDLMFELVIDTTGGGNRWLQVPMPAVNNIPMVVTAYLPDQPDTNTIANAYTLAYTAVSV